MARRCLSEKASHSLSRPSVRSEMAPMGSHESQIKWIVLVSFSPSSSGRCRCRGHCRFPHRRDVGTERQTNERTTTTTTGQLLQRPIKLLNRGKLLRLRPRLHLYTLKPGGSIHAPTSREIFTAEYFFKTAPSLCIHNLLKIIKRNNRHRAEIMLQY